MLAVMFRAGELLLGIGTPMNMSDRGSLPVCESVLYRFLIRLRDESTHEPLRRNAYRSG